MRRRAFYENCYESTFLAGRTIKVALTPGMVDITVSITTASKWDGELRDPEVNIEVRTVDAKGFGGGSSSAIVKFIDVHQVKDGDAKSAKAHQEIRKAFLDADMDHSDVTDYGGLRVLSFEAASKFIDPHSHVNERTLAVLPKHSQEVVFPSVYVDCNRQDSKERRRATIDPKNRGSDGLGDEDGWGSTFFLFSVFELDATPPLYVLGNDDSGPNGADEEVCAAMEDEPKSADELLILQLSASM